MHEVALCHRLAFHLENSSKFTGYLIDCDYNRAEQAKKKKSKRQNIQARYYNSYTRKR